MTSFTTFGLPETVLSALTKIQFLEATPIQNLALPLALAGRDILGSSATGTGKTGAFAIPLVSKLVNSHESAGLIMTPTRELAQQVLATIQPLLVHHHEIKTALLIGGESMGKQFNQLRQNPRLVVGTPGRINDHLSRGTLKINQVDFLVLDESDRMMDMGFGQQIEKIIKFIKTDRQTLMFSATQSPAIVKMSAKYLRNPERIAVDCDHLAADKIKQEVINVTDADKYQQLTTQLDQRQGSVLIFVKTKRGADRLAEKLCKGSHAADALHGNLNQRQRGRVMQAFRDKKNRILVATDVAARGLDVPHIEHVINYDLPQCPEDYIHRIGRTARAGADGCAINLVAPADMEKWRAIRHLMYPGEARAPNANSNGKAHKHNSHGSKRFYGKRRFTNKEHKAA